MADYIDKHGLATLWQRIKDYVSTAISRIEGATPSSTTPKEDGDATAGEETAFARGDHRHPHDTSKVDKVDGKGLSSNDYTDTDKQKVDAIPSNWSYVTYTAGDGISIEEGVISVTGGGGEENVIEVVKVNGEPLTPDADKAVNISVPNVPTNVSAFNNDVGYLTSHQDISGKADKATTLAGYGITDAKIESGTITLGSNTITPLTNHQSLTNYVQKSQTAGLLKNDGNVDTSTYLTQHQDISGKADKIEIVLKGQTDYGTSSQQPYTIQPNKFYVWGELTDLHLALDTVSNSYLDEFMFQFTSGATATDFSLPISVKVIGTVEANKTYQCSIVNNIAVLGGVS